MDTNTKQTLEAIKDLQALCTAAIRTETDQDTKLCLLDIAHDLASCEARLERQDWRDVLNIIDTAARALINDDWN